MIVFLTRTPYLVAEGCLVVRKVHVTRAAALETLEGGSWWLDGSRVQRRSQDRRRNERRDPERNGYLIGTTHPTKLTVS